MWNHVVYVDRTRPRKEGDLLINAKLARLLLTLFTCFVGPALFAQMQTLDSLSKAVNHLIYSAQYDSAQVLTLNYLKHEHLTDLERYHAYSLYAETIRSSGRPKESIVALKWAMNIAQMLPDSALYVSRLNMSIGGAYFDVQDFENARKYAERSIKISPDTSLASVGHAPNYMILGFYEFQQDNFERGKTFYQKARSEYLRKDKQCELPLVYNKLARLENAMGNYRTATQYLDSSRTINRECDIQLYKLLTEVTQYKIFEENKNFKEALGKLEEINEMREEMRYEEQQSRMSRMEQSFEERLEVNEIENLKAINEKNEIILAKQRQSLWIAIAAVVLLGALAVLLFGVNRRRKRAMVELEALNDELEAKVEKRTAHLNEANQRIIKNAETVVRQNSQLKDFYHMITHNLRAPLGNMEMLVRLVKEAKDPAKQNELLSNMQPVVNNLRTTVNDLLDTIQLSAIKEDELKPVSFEKALETAIAGLKTQIDLEQAEIKSDFTQAPEVKHPYEYLVSLFHNFISNSLKYKSKGEYPQIGISTAKIDNRIVLRFQDNGLGIDLAKFGDQVFKAGKVFHQHPDAKGFGLYMTKMQIDNHGGEIRVESTPGDGTTFIVKFRS